MQRNHKNLEDLIKRCQNQTSSQLTHLEDQLQVIQSQSSTIQEYLAGVGWFLNNRLDTITSRINSVGLGVWKVAGLISLFGSSVLGAVLRVESWTTRLDRPFSVGVYFFLEDFMGRESVVTLSLIDSWEAFDGTLKGKFRGKKGGRRISQGRFTLQDRLSGQEISRDKSLENAISPYQRIDMSLVCEVVERGKEESGAPKCPRPSCQTLCSGAPETGITW